MDLGQRFVIGLCVFLVAWYLIVAVLNRRRGLVVYRWLRDGLEKYGEFDESLVKIKKINQQRIKEDFGVDKNIREC